MEIEDEVTEKKRSPFDISKKINSKTALDDQDYAEFNIFMTNKIYSMRPDTIVLAAEMNKYSKLSPNMVLDFYYGMVPKGSSFSPWPKEDVTDDLKTLMMFFDINKRVAKQYIKLLSSEQIKEIKERLLIGGKGKNYATWGKN